jgi:hypothetical protein
MYAVIIGFLLTLVVGYLASWLFHAMKLQTMDRIYVKDSVNAINGDLFSPPFAKRYTRNVEKTEN